MFINLCVNHFNFRFNAADVASHKTTPLNSKKRPAVQSNSWSLSQENIRHAVRICFSGDADNIKIIRIT